jgi:5-methylcytosine-specific restriction endonuclease McrA
MEKYKTCKSCNANLAITEFYKHATTKDRLMNVCKKCHNARCRVIERNNPQRRAEYFKVYYQKNPERMRERSKKYKSNNPLLVAETYRNWRINNPDKDKARVMRRRARKESVASYKVTKKEFAALYAKPCAYCGSTTKICIDHVVPLSRGGTNGIGNYLPACLSCNSSKKDKTLMEWKKVRGW